MTRTLDLGGAWELAYFDETGKLPQTPAELGEHACERVPACVPGNVELDLSREGRLPADLFYGMNLLELRRLEGFQWWYSREFSTPDWTGESGTDLVFEGLDCFATVWVNGNEVGRCANALVPHRFGIEQALAAPGQPNRLVVRLTSPINAVKDLPLDAETEASLSHYESLWARKPPHAYGWDIMPRAVSAGIWRPVRLEERRATELTDVLIDTMAATVDRATLYCTATFRTDLPLRDFTLRVTGRCGPSSFENELPIFFTRAGFEIEVPSPRLWWPRGYGEPNLYEVTATLSHSGHVVSERRFNLGIRTIRLDRTDLHSPEQPGRFSFIVNGAPIFCRGSNWVPADAFHSRDAERLPRILDLFRDMDCNMLRCWGGNVYEPDTFFDFCDREGILVWQDFSMACSAYPQNEVFLKMIRDEAECVVKRLRQHPAIALWSGDNEIDQLYAGWGKHRMDPALNRLTREVLPDVVRRFDPARAYMPSSPCIASAALTYAAPDYSVPEQHLWGPRDYYKSSFYLHNTAIFASEIGYHGCPHPASIRRFISPEKLWPCLENDEWRLHSTDAVPEYHLSERVQLMLTQIREVFGEIPDGLGHFAAASQIVQAEAVKFFIELFRQRKGATTGILWWNIMDGWPQMSDAIVDYYFQKKLAYWFVKRAHGPFTVVVHEPDLGHGGRLEVSAVNDSLAERGGHVRVWDADSGKTLLETDFAACSNARSHCGFITPPDTEQRLLLFTWEEGGRKGAGHYLYGKPPFDYGKYRRDWLPKIAALDGSFDAENFFGE